MSFMDQLTEIVREINSILWGPWCLIPILVGTGIFFTFKTRFVQIRHFGLAFKHVKSRSARYDLLPITGYSYCCPSGYW